MYSNSDVSEFHIQYYIQKLEELTEYDYPFERLKNVMGDSIYKKVEKKNVEKKEEGPEIEEVTDEQAE